MRLLGAAGVDDLVARWRDDVRGLRRARAEARGDDRHSRPALHDLERKLEALLGPGPGFFVEAGAHDGFTQSNTYWLERFRGWSGLLVEPVPLLADRARRRRRAAVQNCALVAPDHPEPTIRMRYGDLMSMVEGAKDPDWPSRGTAAGWREPHTIEVPARTLSSLLDEIHAPEVDLLSLDVEGYEAQALRGLDLARHAPRYVLVEIHDRERDKPPVDAVLRDRYAEHGWLSPLDIVYVRRDLAS